MVLDKTREISDIRMKKTNLLADVQRAYKDGCVSLREARRTLRQLGLEWRRTCLAMDKVCELMGMDRNRTLARLVPDDVVSSHVSGIDSGNSRIIKNENDNHDEQCVPPPDPEQVIDYFHNVDGRLDAILHRLFWIQNNCGDGDEESNNNNGPRQQLAVGDYMSTGSEQEDDFIAQDLDDDKNRHVKLLTTVDVTSLPIETQQLDIGYVPSLCPE